MKSLDKKVDISKYRFYEKGTFFRFLPITVKIKFKIEKVGAFLVAQLNQFCPLIS
jgi:hypothetical protein